MTLQKAADEQLVMGTQINSLTAAFKEPAPFSKTLVEKSNL